MREPSGAILSWHRVHDLVIERGVDGQLLRRRRRYLTGAPSARRPWRRVRHWTLPGVEVAAAGPTLRARVPLAAVTSPWGFSLAPGGWHPYAATLRADDDGRAEDHDHPLFRHYARYRPRTTHEALLEHLEDPLEPLASWPIRAGLLNVWALTPDRVRRALRAADRPDRPRQLVGPHPDESIRQDIARLRDLRRSIEANGYAPERFDGTQVTGYFLVRNGDLRFVCRHGNHRVAVLAHLGYDEVEVEVPPHVPPVVHHDDLAWWCVEQGGLYPPAVAEALFDKMFTECGRVKAVNLGIIDP